MVGQGGGESEGSQGGGSGSSTDSQSQKSSGSESSKSGEGQQGKSQEMFELKSNDILTNNSDEVNWDSIKIEVENLYNDLPSITMDLYQLNNINQEDILNFNKEYDNLTTIVKDENSKDTLNQLTKIYDYLPKFLRSSEQEELYTTLVETKANIFKGYSKLDTENWDEISNDIKTAINVYSKLLTTTDIEQYKQSNISKGYIMINELQNAVSLKDKEVFLIKYKNLLQEISKM